MANSVDVQIEGAERLARVAGAIARQMPELRKDLLRGIRAGAKPAVKHVKDETAEYFPNSGGMAKFAKKSSIGVRTRTSGEGAGVRIVGQKKGHDIRSMNRGRLRHPLFGNRKHWYTQDVKPSWWNESLTDQKEQITLEVLHTMDQFLESIERDIG